MTHNPTLRKRSPGQRYGSWPNFFRRLNNRLRRAGVYVRFDSYDPHKYILFRPAGVEKEEGFRNSNNPFLEKDHEAPISRASSREQALDEINDWLDDERLDRYERQMTGGGSWEDEPDDEDDHDALDYSMPNMASGHEHWDE